MLIIDSTSEICDIGSCHAIETTAAAAAVVDAVAIAAPPAFNDS